MAGKKVLVVDDDTKTVELVKLYLSRDSYRVLTAYDGIEALRLAREGHPDLIVLDLMLPGMDGLEVCRTLRAESDVPIIMLTARTTDEDKLTGLGLGADDYVTKPFSPRELVLRIKAILRRKEIPSEGMKIIQIDDLLIDIDRHQVSVKKKPLPLTSTEFKLLVELVSNKGRVQTRERLLDKVWGYTYEGYARTVDTHIRRLREKLGTAGDLIETIRGVGYRFREEEE